MNLAYRAASAIVFGAALPLLWLHPKLRGNTARRLGRYAEPAPWPPPRVPGADPAAAPRVWLHGASAGDVNALAPMVRGLRARLPEATLVLSAMTNSGLASAERLRKEIDGVTVLPYELPGAAARAMRVIRPDVLVLEYNELWPNLVDAARAAGARVVLTNGRIHERLVERYRWTWRVFGSPLGAVDRLLMREPVEAERALSLGAPRERVFATGNTKFDNLSRAPEASTIEALRRDMGLVEGAPLLVLGSTHDGEERAIFAALAARRAEAPGLRVLVAPRYTERGERVAELAREVGFSVALRTERRRGVGEPRADVLVLDTIGELTAAYALATVVFVGGSFVSRGGQNILEPAGSGRPVLFGPSMSNFRDSVEVLLGRGGLQVEAPQALVALVLELLGRPDEMTRLGAMARAAVEKVSGASARNVEHIVAAARAPRSA